MGLPSEAESALRSSEEVLRRLGALWDLKRTRSVLDGMSGEGVRTTLAFKKLEVLMDVTRTLSSEIELEPLLDRILEKAIDLTRTERGFVILYDSKGNPVFHSTRSIARAEVEEGKVAQLSSTVTRRVLNTGSAIAVTNVEQEFDLRTQASIVELGLRAIMCAPLKRGSRILGLIYVDSATIPEGFYQADVSLLEALADAAAVSLENAQLFSALRRKTDLMSILAHEFRSPISASIMFTHQLLQEGELFSAEQRGRGGSVSRRDAHREEKQGLCRLCL
jgi:GAF domain-containing protein